MNTIKTIRSSFPILNKSDSPVYLDSAASSQKPQQVIDRINKYYNSEHANVHRGIYKLSEKATLEFENVRKKSAHFLGGVKNNCVIFTSGTTESINLIAHSWGRENLKEGDEILLPVSEHHSNIVPWHIVAQATGAKLKFIPLNNDLRIDVDTARTKLTKKTKIITFAHVSNVLGTVNPVKELVNLAKEVGAVSIIDGAQGAPHSICNAKEIDPDFYSFSSHKMCGPTGVGVLYGKEKLLESMPPYKGGGEMILTVEESGSKYADLPHKFEAGTPNISSVIGLGAAIDFLNNIDTDFITKHELTLGKYLLEQLSTKKHITCFVKDTRDWKGIVSFHHKVIHPHDMAAVLDNKNICVRAGHHCAQPLMKFLEVAATTRVSPYIYNNKEDIDCFLEALEKAESIFC